MESQDSSMLNSDLISFAFRLRWTWAVAINLLLSGADLTLETKFTECVYMADNEKSDAQCEHKKFLGILI